MNTVEILKDKSLKPKQKIEIISQFLLNNSLTSNELIKIANGLKEVDKANCIEAMEYASQKYPPVIDATAFEFVLDNLSSKTPRIKWESARVIANSAHLFPDKLEKATIGLLENTEHEGTVVRWSAAFALAQIIKLKTSLNTELFTTLEFIIEKEEKNSIKKIYIDAIKKSNK